MTISVTHQKTSANQPNKSLPNSKIVDPSTTMNNNSYYSNSSSKCCYTNKCSRMRRKRSRIHSLSPIIVPGIKFPRLRTLLSVKLTSSTTLAAIWHHQVKIFSGFGQQMEASEEWDHQATSQLVKTQKMTSIQVVSTNNQQHKVNRTPWWVKVFLSHRASSLIWTKTV